MCELHEVKWRGETWRATVRGVKASLAIVLLVAAAAAPAHADEPAHYPTRARVLCSEHVAAKTLHVRWTLIATADAPETVIAWYARTQHATFVQDGAVRTWKPDADHVVTVATPAQLAALPHCDVAPTAAEHAVILTSQAIR